MIRNILKASSFLIPLELLKIITNQKLLLPFYHVVSDEDLPHIKHLYPYRNTSTFRKDLEYLLKHYQPVDLNQLTDIVKGTKKLTKPSFYLTFDDGLKQVNDNIIPILKEYGLTSTFFLNSAFIDNKALMYRYKASLLIDHIINYDQSAEAIRRTKELLKVPTISKRDIIKAIKNINYKSAYLLDELSLLLHVDFKVFLDTYKPYISTEQIKQIMQDGFTIGAHSVDHPVYSYISLEEQIKQTKESVQWVSKNFNTPIKTFAFPFTDNGVSNSFFEEAQKNHLVDISFGTAGLKEDCIKNNVQRIPMEHTQHSAAQIIKSEYLYYILKAPFGKNKIRRK